MSTQVLNYLDAIAHLPAGGTLILNDVAWEEYEQLLADLGDSSGNRVSYDSGRLEVMSPSSEHESIAILINLLVPILSDEAGLSLEGLGSTTYKQKSLGRGVEPDACFYVTNAARIIGTRKVDLQTDPPPDIVVEVDISHSSAGKLAIYAGMRVPEVWIHDGARARFYQLIDQEYREIDRSFNFAALTSDRLSYFLHLGITEGQTVARRSFQEWLRREIQTP